MPDQIPGNTSDPAPVESQDALNLEDKDVPIQAYNLSLGLRRQISRDPRAPTELEQQVGFLDPSTDQKIRVGSGRCRLWRLETGAGVDSTFL